VTEKAWKRTERAVARRLGGTRIPITGRQRGDAKDIKHPWISCEVKHRKAPPGWTFLWDAMDQAVQSANKGDLPITVVHKTRVSHDKDMVVMFMEDFEKWFIEGIADEGSKGKWELFSDRSFDVPRITSTEDLLIEQPEPQRGGSPRVVEPDAEAKRRAVERAFLQIQTRNRYLKDIPEK